jgi:primosomal protein N'
MRKMYKKIDNYQLVVASSLVRHWPADITLNVAMMTDADAGIGLPQYTAPADTFRRLYDSIVHLPCRDMIIQTRQPDHPIIRQACGLRREDFEADDKVFRQQHQYPPYGQLAVISYKHETESRVFSTVNKLYKEISYIIAKGPSDTLSWSDDIQSYATPPLVYKMFDKYRYQIIIKGSDIRSLLDHLTTDLRIRERKFQIDRMAREVG